jgi:predicted nucleic acid-binding protein
MRRARYWPAIYLYRVALPGFSQGAQSQRESVFRDVRKAGATFSVTDQERLKAILTSRRLLTTAHVMVEVTTLREHSQLARLSGFRAFSLEFLSKGAISEERCPVTELCAQPEFLELACRLGLTDAGLVFVATRYECLLLTDDSRLFGVYSAGAKFQIRLLDHYLARTDELL